jgi:hypothetical protein
MTLINYRMDGQGFINLIIISWWRTYAPEEADEAALPHRLSGGLDGAANSDTRETT